MQLGNLGVTDLEAAAAGLVDQLPSLARRRILERRAASAALDRLRGFARFGNAIHLRGNRGAVTGSALEHSCRENDLVRHAAVAVAELHVGIAEDMKAAAPVKA